MSALAMTRTSYVSRVGDFGDFGDRAARTVKVPLEVEGVGGVRLWLTGACPPRSRLSFWADYQVYRGVLRVPGRRPRRVPVEVELSPWSTGRTEVGLQSARPRRPEGNHRYFAAASRAVEALVCQLEERPALVGPDASFAGLSGFVSASAT